MVALGEEISIPMHTKQKQIMDTAFKALARAMESMKQDSKSMEITESVLLYL